MTYGRRIAQHAKQVASLRSRQIERVRDACRERGLSTRRAGRLVGLTELRGLFSEDWSPAQEVLDRLEAELFGEGDAGLEPLYSTEITSSRSLRIRAQRCADAVDIWRHAEGVWSAEVARKLEDSNVLAQSTTIRDTPKGLFVEEKSDHFGFWGKANSAQGILLFDRPDPDFNAFVFKRAMEPLATDQPRVDRCVGWCGLIGVNLRYVAGLLPFSCAPGQPSEILLSVVQPEPGCAPPLHV